MENEDKWRKSLGSNLYKASDLNVDHNMRDKLMKYT